MQAKWATRQSNFYSMRVKVDSCAMNSDEFTGTSTASEIPDISVTASASATASALESATASALESATASALESATASATGSSSESVSTTLTSIAGVDPVEISSETTSATSTATSSATSFRN